MSSAAFIKSTSLKVKTETGGPKLSPMSSPATALAIFPIILNAPLAAFAAVSVVEVDGLEGYSSLRKSYCVVSFTGSLALPSCTSHQLKFRSDVALSSTKTLQ